MGGGNGGVPAVTRAYHEGLCRSVQTTFKVRGGSPPEVEISLAGDASSRKGDTGCQRPYTGWPFSPKRKLPQWESRHFSVEGVFFGAREQWLIGVLSESSAVHQGHGGVLSWSARVCSTRGTTACEGTIFHAGFGTLLLYRQTFVAVDRMACCRPAPESGCDMLVCN